MEPTRPGTPPARDPRRRFVAPAVFGVVIAVIAVWVAVSTANSRDPEETVEAFLTAIVEKDVEGALELVTRYGYGVPYGESARFLTPGAIADDWWVVSVSEVDREYRSTARVKAVLAGPDGTAEGVFVVEEDDEEWLMSDPFVQVRFPASPLSYLQVNDEVVPRPTGTHGYEYYDLFPGTYRFYQSVPEVVDAAETGAVMAFPLEDADSRDILPPALSPGEDAVAGLRKAVRERIDDCAGFATGAPYGDCPFATDGEIDTPDGKRVNELHGLTWTVTTYPVAEMTDDRTIESGPGFALRAAEPGAVTLSGSGSDTEGRPTSFTVTCDIGLTGLMATVGVDGAVTLAGTPAAADAAPYGTFDTCRDGT